MKILICAAGSGGHIYPALSLAAELKSVAPASEIIFLCSRKNVDKKIFKDSSFKVIPTDFRPISSKNSRNPLILILKNFYFLLKLMIESFRVFMLLVKIKADVIIGFGGISSIGVILGAGLLRIPTLIHEQNLIPGLANRLLARISTKVAIGFAQTSRHFKSGNIVFTGNPIRNDLETIEKKRARVSLGLANDKFTILVFGGSQGSYFINACFMEALNGLPEKEKNNLQVIHITGKRENSKICAGYKELNVRAAVFSYLAQMSAAYSACDLVVSRAGASTLGEISYFSRAAILIPYPYARGHQVLNAKFMQEQEAAFVVVQNNKCSAELAGLICRLMPDPGSLEKMATAAHRLYNADAATKLAAEVRGLVKT